MISWRTMNTAFTKQKDAVSGIAYIPDYMIECNYNNSWAYTDLLNSSISFQDVIITSFLLPQTENPAHEILNAWGPMTRAFHGQVVRLENRAIP